MIPVFEFNAALACALAAAAKTVGGHAVLMSVLFEFLPDGVVRFVATDGKRLTFVECRAPHAEPAGSSFVLYSEYARKLVKVFPAKSNTRVSVFVYGDQIIFTDGETVEIFNKLEWDPRFPDYSRVLTHAETPPRTCTMPIDQIVEALATFKPFAGSGVKIELHHQGPSYFIPNLRPDLESIIAAQTVIMSFK
jgi:DNA polymerase III sliding clamp (beta) subunit (PCNA family)